MASSNSLSSTLGGSYSPSASVFDSDIGLNGGSPPPAPKVKPEVEPEPFEELENENPPKAGFVEDSSKIEIQKTF